MSNREIDENINSQSHCASASSPMGTRSQYEHLSSVGGEEVSEDDIELDDEFELENECPSKKRKENESRSIYWEHFVKFYREKDKVQAKCNYCGREIKADPRTHGTKSLKNHYTTCKKKPHEVATNQVRVAFQPVSIGGEKNLMNWRFDQEKTRQALCFMLIVDELPFKTVENLGFKHFMSVACPMFVVPSRKTIAKDIFNLYVDEKTKLNLLLKHSTQRVSITIDTWTSLQNVNYMCLTAHFIDNDWKLHKRILNFCPISGHKGEEIGRAVEKCLFDWGIENIFSITVDNASSNDDAIGYLQKKLGNWSNTLLGCKYLHVRCIAHIINLVVQDGLKGKDEQLAISRIRSAVRYIRNSPSRYQRFIDCVKLEKLKTNKLLCLDVPTRWNSTYLMLEAACSLKNAFEPYEDVDPYFRIDLEKPPFHGVPNECDWERATLLLGFLGHFYELTLCISGSLDVTSNTIFHEITAVDLLLKELLYSDDLELSDMARRMKEKYDKYWGDVEKVNKILYYAVILDPRYKLDFVLWSFDKLYDDDVVKREHMKKNVQLGMEELFKEYKERYNPSGVPLITSSSVSNSVSRKTFSIDASKNIRRYLNDEYMKFRSEGMGARTKTEYEKYLSEDVECDDYDNEGNKMNFDVLVWWKLNAHRYPILSKIARDILVVPVSTVASDAAFSTEGRVLDAFRSSLPHKIVQALICAQDWLRLSSKPVCVEENLSEIETIERELSSLGNAGNGGTSDI